MCGQFVMAAQAEWRTANIDPQPTTRHGEALAQLQGRHTYAMDRAGKLYERDRWQIGAVTDHWRYDLFADHACGQPLPITESVFVNEKRQSHDQPPF